jgi:hypothetical protein
LLAERCWFCSLSKSSCFKRIRIPKPDFYPWRDHLVILMDLAIVNFLDPFQHPSNRALTIYVAPNNYEGGGASPSATTSCLAKRNNATSVGVGVGGGVVSTHFSVQTAVNFVWISMEMWCLELLMVWYNLHVCVLLDGSVGMVWWCANVVICWWLCRRFCVLISYVGVLIVVLLAVEVLRFCEQKILVLNVPKVNSAKRAEEKSTLCTERKFWSFMLWMHQN